MPGPKKCSKVALAFSLLPQLAGLCACGPGIKMNAVLGLIASAPSPTPTSSSLSNSKTASANLSTVTVSPSSITADGSTHSTVTVTLHDDAGTAVSGKTVSLSASGTANSISAASGVSSFTGVVTFTVSSTIVGSATLTATDSTDSVTLSTIPTLTFTAGGASKLAFTTEPSLIENSGTRLLTQPVVQVQDASGNPVSTAFDSITLGIYTDSGCTNPAMGSLGAGSNPLAAVSGVASFSLVTYTGAPATIYLGASASGLASACSSPILAITGTQLSANPASLHGCALDSLAGGVYCWGQNGYGQLGDTTTNEQDAPIQVLTNGGSDSLSGVVSLAVGAFHTCALSSDETVSCWGRGASGELGNGSTLSQSLPVQVLGVGGTGTLSGITGISSGDNHACALSSAGNIYCWGFNGDGELGNNATGNLSTPVEVEGVGGAGFLAGISSLGIGAYHSCALTTGGNVYCWGSGGDGSLGNDGTADEHTPVEVTGVGGAGLLSGIASIAGGTEHTCAVATGGNAYCWGLNTYGELGINSTSQQNAPVEVEGVGGAGFLSSVAKVATGHGHTCALTTGGNVYCWGDNTFGQLGNNSTLESNTPVEVEGVGGAGFLSGVTTVAAGMYQTCAATNAGSVYCWGENNHGQLGINSTADSHTPVQVQGVGGAGFLWDI